MGTKLQDGKLMPTMFTQAFISLAIGLGKKSVRMEAQIGLDGVIEYPVEALFRKKRFMLDEKFW